MVPLEIWCKDLAGSVNTIIERDLSHLRKAVEESCSRDQIFGEISQITGKLAGIRDQIKEGPAEGLGGRT